MTPSSDIARLIEIMRALRAPGTGCPWDLEQDFRTIAPYTIEEAYEVADAIERGEMGELCDELGDLLLQVVYHAQMASEAGAFAFPDVVLAITTKMIRRHPHVFGDEAARSAKLAKGFWNSIKAAERAAKRQNGEGGETAWLDDVPLALPALTRALKLQSRAAQVGFDWREAAPILDKIEEELNEFRAAQGVGDKSEMEAEFGDLLFSLVNYGRHLGIDPEAALRATNDKFRNRFGFIEERLGEKGAALGSASLEEMEALWQEAKAPG